MTLPPLGIALETDQEGVTPPLSGAEPRLHARIFAILAGRIAEGTLPAGSRLLESHVARQFGISRAPARQALARLAAEGMIARRGRGYAVGGIMPQRPAAAPPPEPTRLVPASSWQRFYAEVERAIVSRTAFASWRVVETDLARHCGVSRTVARDMIARLHQRGILRRDDRFRWYAPALTPAYMTELYELRWLLEPVALIKAMAGVPPGLVSALRQRLEQAMARAESLDGRMLDALETDLHVRLLGHCGNQALMESIRLYQSLLAAHSFIYDWAPHLVPVEPFLPEHLRVLERLELGHAQSAADALAEHLRASLGRAITRIEAVARESCPTPPPYLKPL